MKVTGITLTCDQAVLHPFFVKRQGNRVVPFSLYTDVVYFLVVLFAVYILSRALDGNRGSAFLEFRASPKQKE